jgi:hypothetical protein
MKDDVSGSGSGDKENKYSQEIATSKVINLNMFIVLVSVLINRILSSTRKNT